MRLLVLRWFFFGGFAFLIGVGVWTIVTVTRLKREQLIALQILQVLADRLELKVTVDTIQKRVPSD